MKQKQAIALIKTERDRQDGLFGGIPRNLQESLWALILLEEALEVTQETSVEGDSEVLDLLSELALLKERVKGLLERRGMKGAGSGGDLSPRCSVNIINYKAELIQVAAVAIAALEDLS